MFSLWLWQLGCIVKFYFQKSGKTLYGFEDKFFLDVLHQKAKYVYPNIPDGEIWDNKVPEMLDHLYTSMNHGDDTVNTQIKILQIKNDFF